MMFFELDEGEMTLADIRRITQGLLHNKYVLSQLTAKQYTDLAYIVTPTLASDHNEDNIRARWNKVITDFTIKDAHGKPMRFYHDPVTCRLFFGDEAGWHEAQAFRQHEIDPSLLKKYHNR